MSPAKRPGFDKGAFYRAARWLHAYLSAFAFLALIFFSFTGLLLDHPDWLQGKKPAERESAVRLSPAELAAAKAAQPKKSSAGGKAKAAKSAKGSAKRSRAA